MTDGNYPSRELVPLVSKGESENNEDETEEKLENKAEHTLSNWQAAMHLFKAFAGVGMLGFPSGIYHSGLVAGPIALFLTGAATLYGMIILIRTTITISKRTGIESFTYGNLAKEIISLHNEDMGNFTRLFLDVIICAMQLGFCTVYFEFIGGAMQKILHSSNTALMTTAFLPLILGLALITNVRKLVYSTVAANIALVVVVMVLFYYFLPHLRTPVHYEIATNPVSFLIGFGQFLFGFEGIGTLPTLHSKMKHKDELPKVLVITMLIIIFLYLSFGLTGYLAFGAETKPSVTFNLPDQPLYQSLNGIYILISISSYPVQFFVPIDIAISHLEDRLSKNRLVLAEFGLRIVLVLFTFALAIAIPQLDNYMALIGCSTATVVTFIVPTILHTLCFWNEGLSREHLVLNAMVFVFGVLSLVTGTFASVLSIIRRFQNPKAI